MTAQRIPVVQSLEFRRLLAASVANGTLSITGTDSADTIEVHYVAPLPNQSAFTPYYKVVFNGTTTNFTASNIHHVKVKAKGGNDLVNLAGDPPIPMGAMRAESDAVMVSSTVSGGSGKDTIYGSQKNDWLYGNSGDDVIVGKDGNDHLVGGSGNDQLGNAFVEAGNDSLDGGDGNDSLMGGAGNDRLDGGHGNDTVNGYTGTDKVTGGSGADHFFKNLDPKKQILDFHSNDINDGGEILPEPV